MVRAPKENAGIFVLTVGLFSWLIPGGGYFLLKENKRAIIICVTILATFCMGLYIGSIGVIDPVGGRPWYMAQVLNSPIVFVLGYHTAGGGFPVFGRPGEIGQIYTSIAGLLNLLCIVNGVYLAHRSTMPKQGGQNAF